MEPLLALSLLLLLSFAGAVVARRIGAPSLVGNLVAGVVVGPSVLRILDDPMLEHLDLVNTLALALIALSIGRELRFDRIKEPGRVIPIVSVLEASGAFLAVAGAMLLLGQPLYLSLIFGSIAIATAPAGTIAVLHEYGARGRVTAILLACVALGNVYSVVVFGIVIALTPAMMKPGVSSASWLSLMAPLIDIIGAVFLGMVLGYALHIASSVARLARAKDEVLFLLVLAVSLLSVGLADTFDLCSEMLLIMSVAAMVANLSATSARIFDTLLPVETTIYTAFFALAGASMHLPLLLEMGLVGVAYVVARPLGKYIGASSGAWLAKTTHVTQRYLGLGLLSQAGLAISLVILVQQRLPELGPVVTTVVLGGVTINEIVGPFTLKLAITKARETGRAQGEYETKPTIDPLTTLTVADAMTKEHETILSTAPLAELAAKFQSNGGHGFPVVNEAGELVGIATLADLQRVALQGYDGLTVSDIATKQVVVTYPDETLRKVLEDLGSLNHERVPVVESGNRHHILGVLRRRDILEAYSKAIVHLTQGYSSAILRL